MFFRAARAALGYSRDRVAKETKMWVGTLRRSETLDLKPNAGRTSTKTIETLLAYYRKRGMTLEAPGVWGIDSTVALEHAAGPKARAPKEWLPVDPPPFHSAPT